MDLINVEKVKFQILSYQLKLRDIENVFEHLEKKGIVPVLIKGAAAAVYYPKPFLRAFSDIDVAVDPEQFEAAKKIILKANFNVDLHCGLRHLDTLEWKDLILNSKLIKLNKTKVRVLSREDHLRVLCVHWLNDGGADRTRLWDIYFTINYDQPNFKWENFLEKVSQKRKYWLIISIMAAEQFLGLELSQNYFDRKAYEFPHWIKKELENEWKNDVRLSPLDQTLYNRRMLWEQLKKRLPPNYLQSIVETDSHITVRKNVNVLIKDFLFRAKPSIKRILRMDGNNNF